MTYDFIIVGAGIGGLSIAELLQRSGRSVLLLEGSAQICGGASAEQQGWFHTGALYAALPDPIFSETMAGNIDTLLTYYSGFSRMNLERGRPLRIAPRRGWFGASPVQFLYTSPANDRIPHHLRLPWATAMGRAAQRLAWFSSLDFTRPPAARTALRNYRLTRDEAATYSLPSGQQQPDALLPSNDRSLDSEALMRDLLNSFLFSGGVLKTCAPVAEILSAGVRVADGSFYRGRRTILTAGRRILDFNPGVRVVKSPLLVVRPAITSLNFAQMHPVLSETLNHVCHQTPDGAYSVFGNAAYFDASANPPIDQLQIRMLVQVNSFFGTNIPLDRTALYFGYKTEVPAAQGTRATQRNYRFEMFDAGNHFVVLPGKLSLAFSAAVGVCERLGVKPRAEVGRFPALAPENIVSRTRHRTEFAALAARAGASEAPSRRTAGAANATKTAEVTLVA